MKERACWRWTKTADLCRLGTEREHENELHVFYIFFDYVHLCSSTPEIRQKCQLGRNLFPVAPFCASLMRLYRA